MKQRARKCKKNKSVKVTKSNKNIIYNFKMTKGKQKEI